MTPLRSLACFCLLLSVSATAQQPGVRGTWREPGGSVITIAPCGSDICATLVALPKDSPIQTDAHNPDANLRSRPLCGLQIGTDFHPAGNSSADGGKLYDPKTGKTYHGTMTAEGNTLHLRGYIGLKAFGRTEDWTRTGPDAATCRK